jgi:hypothetical protein
VLTPDLDDAYYVLLFAAGGCMEGSRLGLSFAEIDAAFQCLTSARLTCTARLAPKAANL